MDSHQSCYCSTSFRLSSQVLMRTIVLGNAHPIVLRKTSNTELISNKGVLPMHTWSYGLKMHQLFHQKPLIEVLAFIDHDVSCHYPENDCELQELIQAVQRHTHSFTCRKHGSTCRFHFSRPPVETTKVFIPTDTYTTPSQQVHLCHYQNILANVHLQLANQTSESPLSFQNMFHNISVSQEEYYSALEWIKTKQGHPAILYKRQPS